MSNDGTSHDGRDDAAWSQTVALRLIAGLLLAGAAWVLAAILVPLVLAQVLTIAFSPLADRLERRGLPRTASSLVCTLAAAAFLAVAVGLMAYQAGTIIRDGDRYVNRFGTLVDRAIARAGLAHDDPAQGQAGPAVSARADRPGDHETGRPTRGVVLIRRFLTAAGQWLVTGVGGLLGSIGEAVVVLAFLFYMLNGRGEWVESITEAFRSLGFRPSRDQLGKIREDVVHYVSVLAMVACGYVVVVSLALWMIGVPRPLLWGMMAGLFEVVPYFGPLVASVLPTIVSLSLGSTWQPLATAGLFVVLHTVEGYLITPTLYGRAVKLDPVTILFGALFFGALWGPVGLAVATPMMILLRGLLMIVPDTPALDALADVQEEKAAVQAPEVVRAGHNGG